MILVENPVPATRRKAEEIAQQVLATDMTNIIMSQWQVEEHDQDGIKYVAYCAINRRLDPLDKPLMLHMKAASFEQLQELFHSVEWVA